MYKDIKYNEQLSQMYHQLDRGAFLTTKNDDKVNTMSIAWGGVNLIWGKEIFIAYVRYTRDTYTMLTNTEEFTISVPVNKNMKKEIRFCGTKSGRDYDKIAECGLTLSPGRVVDTPVIQECDLHYECKIIYRQIQEPNSIPKEVLKKYYKNNDFHVIFYGEIVDSYIIESE